MSKQKTQVEIGNEALARLSLPTAEELISEASLHSNFSVLAQALDKVSAGGELNSYIAKRLPHAIEQLSGQASTALMPSDPPSALNMASWMAWIEGWPTTTPARARAASEARLLKGALEKARASAPPLLMLSLELARLVDRDAVARCEPLDEVWLHQLRTDPPKMNEGVDSVILAFGVANPGGQSRTTFRVFFTVRLVLPDGISSVFEDPVLTPEGEARRVLPSYVPPSNPEMIFSSSEFFRDGEPLGEFDEISLAEIAGRPWPEDAYYGWRGFMGELDARCVAAFGKPIHEFAPALFGRHTRDIRVRIIDEANIRPSPWCAVLQELVDGKKESVLALTLLKPHDARDVVRLSSAPRDLFLGHMDSRDESADIRKPAFPLDCTQRLAAMQAMVLEPVEGRCHLPVNGPPGSGKTSFLKALLASQWVLAAVEQRERPPLVYATGATNKAVINVIEAFSDVVGTDPYSMEGRWVEGLPSYGWFFPSQKAADDFPQLMHLRYSEATRQPHRPSGAAQAFADIDAEQHRDRYLECASVVLGLGGDARPTLENAATALHERLARHRNEMISEVKAFEMAIGGVCDAFIGPKARAGDVSRMTHDENALKAEIETIAAQVMRLGKAIRLGMAYRTESRRLLAGWRSWLPRAIRERLFRKELTDLGAIEVVAAQAFGAAGLGWTPAWLLLDDVLSTAKGTLTTRKQRHEAASQERHLIAASLRTALLQREARRDAVCSLISRTLAVKQLPPTELPTARYAIALGRKLSGRSESARDMLWARFDARQDLDHRVAMFHLAARYWEGRWIAETLRTGEQITGEVRLQRAMMLGVIIVATTHQVCKLGKDAIADLLVMDEAGQCLPVVALSASACAKTAIFVGDTKQLQPINLLSADSVDQIARRCGLHPGDVPEALSPCTGSGMALAKHAARWTDGRDKSGITLLYHYRCHPVIAGYCSELLYDGALRYVRPDKLTAFGEPPMAWVDVDVGAPVRRGTSWVNPSEAAVIVDWIEQIHDRLRTVYGKPLDEVLAIITPMAGQAACIKEELSKRLEHVLGADVVDRLIVGTVHRLQGAERPVVAFSLVQHLETNPKLFGDRDGGFLMNVAVSRAKDCFIVFGQRRTYWPGPGDSVEAAKSRLQRTPVAKLGTYMRKHGRRLFPKHLVVVEAPGKVLRVGKALGLQVAVVATEGMLQDSTLAVDGTLQWKSTNERTMNAFVDALRDHCGLIESMVIATDDDLAGELIGWQVAELAAGILGDVQVRRMRFHTLVETELRQALAIAGPDFDAELLTAALVREYARHMDRKIFKAKLPDSPYQSASRRAIVAIAAELAPHDGYSVELTATDYGGHEHRGFVAADSSALAGPARMHFEEANAMAQQLLHRASVPGDLVPVRKLPLFRSRDGREPPGVELAPVKTSTVVQVPPLYPPSTTLRMLEVAADELNMMPWDAQAEMNAMYQQGADV